MAKIVTTTCDWTDGIDVCVDTNCKQYLNVVDGQPVEADLCDEHYKIHSQIWRPSKTVEVITSTHNIRSHSVEARVGMVIQIVNQRPGITTTEVGNYLRIDSQVARRALKKAEASGDIKFRRGSMSHGNAHCWYPI